MMDRFLAALALAWAATAHPAGAQQEVSRARAVVELYTSQGCTQCPRANRFLSMFAREEGVLALTFPVGIWDYLGWRDTFAQPGFTARQSAYSRALRVRGRFTPQLVFDGARQASASGWDEARAIYDAQRANGLPDEPEIALSVGRNARGRAEIGTGPAGSSADIWMLAFEPEQVSIMVYGGLNRGRSVDHYNLVRWIDRVGVWTGEAISVERARCYPQCAVIVQEPDGGRILAAAFTHPSR